MRHVLADAVRIAFRPTRRNVLHWVSWAAALTVQGLFVLLLKDGSIYDWEADVAREIQKTPGRFELFDASNYLTNTIAWEFVPLIGTVVAISLWLRHFLAALLFVLTFPLHVLAQWPKAVLDRPRPPAGFDGLDGVGGFQSFPSGHSEFVVTFWGFAAFILLLHADRPWQRALVLVPFLGLVVATGYGRVALGRHWPLDVLVSYVVGLGLLSGLIWIYAAVREAQGRSIS